MVYYRRKFSKFPKSKRATTTKRKMVYSRKLSKYSKPSKYFVHTSKIDYDAVVVNGGSYQNGVLSFTLDQSKDYTNFRNTFDEYKILKVKVQWLIENKDYQAGVNAVAGQIYSAIDYSDDSLPSLSDIQAYKSCKMTQAPRSHYRAFVPKPQQPVYNGALSTAYAPMQPQWIPTTYERVPHYALKYYFNGGVGTGISMIVKPIVTYIIAYRGPR